MLALVISLLVLVGLLVLRQKGALPSGDRPPLVLHYPASGPSPVALLALTDRSVILDRAAAALHQRGDEAFRQLLAAFDDVRAGDTVGATLEPRPQQLPLAVRVSSAEYAEMVAALEKLGVKDPHVVAEALWAATAKGAVPTLLTADQELAQKLAPGGAPYRGATPESITFRGRSVRIRTIRLAV